MSMLTRLKALPNFSASMLTITLKLGGVGTLKFKPLQYRIQAAAELQLEEQGNVDLVMVKPRQVRASTWGQAFLYEEMYGLPGTQALTVTHKGAVTDELFLTLKRFQEYMPPDIKQRAKKDNEDLLYLANESKAKVATLGSDGARGFPCRFLVIEELGRCTARQVKDLQEGAMQTLATGADTVKLIISTSGGSGNYFHNIAKQGREKGERVRTVFFGWHEEPEYTLPAPKNWEPASNDKALMEEFGWDINQAYWRAEKIKTEFEGSVSAFNQEYPATFEMAFEEVSGKLINALAILRAKNSTINPIDHFPTIMGVDPAGSGKNADRTGICIRKGNVVLNIQGIRGKTEAELIGIIGRLMNDFEVHTCFIDMGYGHTMVSLLRDLGRTNVVGIHFGQSATRPDIYANMRAEMAAEGKKWLEQGPEEEGGFVRIPDDKDFIADLKAIPELIYVGSKALFYLPSKEEIRKDLGKSPDLADSFFLTFAYPVRSHSQFSLIQIPSSRERQSILQTNRVFNELQTGEQQATLNPNFKYFSFGDKK